MPIAVAPKSTGKSMSLAKKSRLMAAAIPNYAKRTRKGKIHAGSECV